MKFYTNRHKYYCGIDLHAKTMYVCIVDGDGKVLVHRDMRTTPEALLSVIAPYREDIAIAVECMFCWYWIADLCAEEGITFVLGHALYMKAIHGGKAKNDRIDSEKIAQLLKAGLLPKAYVYPREMRAARDVVRRRMFLVHKRGELLAHIQMTYQQYNLPPPSGVLVYTKNREKLEMPFKDPSIERILKVELDLVAEYTRCIHNLENHILQLTKQKNENAMQLALLQTIPGIGSVLSTTILYEIHDIHRFPTVQDFSSYCRLIKPKKTSAGKTTGSGGRKIGNAHLRWAFSEAAVLSMRTEEGKRIMDKLLRKYPKPKALAVLAHRIGRAVYFMLLREKPWSEEKFMPMAA